VEVFAAEARQSGGKLIRPVSRFLGDVGEADASGHIPIIMSTSREDRAGDTVSDDGWELTDYLRNPVLLWSHDHSIPAIGRMVGVATGPLRGDMEFIPREVNAFAGMIGEMYRLRFLKGGSVGFMPDEYSFHDAGGVDFKRQTLLEFSACNVGMNADCLAGAKSAGVDVALFLPFAEKTLDGAEDAPFWLPPKQAMTVYRSLTGPRVQVPAGPSASDVLAEIRTIGAALAEQGKAIAALQKARTTVPAQAPVAPMRAPASAEAIAAATAAEVRRQLSVLMGRVTE